MGFWLRLLAATAVIITLGVVLLSLPDGAPVKRGKPPVVFYCATHGSEELCTSEDFATSPPPPRRPVLP